MGYFIIHPSMEQRSEDTYRTAITLELVMNHHREPGNTWETFCIVGIIPMCTQKNKTKMKAVATNQG